MALEWVDRIDGVDDASAEDVNTLAHAIIELENKDGDYELIEEITFNETTSDFLRNTDLEGNPYAFSSVYIEITTPKGRNAGIGDLWINVDYCVAAFKTLFSNADEAISKALVLVRGGIMSTQSWSGLDDGTSTEQFNYSDCLVYGVQEINTVEILASNMPSGTNIKIYAIRG